MGVSACSSLILTLLPLSSVKKYGLRTGAGKLLAPDGSLVPEVTPQTLYSLELNNGLVALRDEEGKYLTAREGTMKTAKMDKPGRDELFSIEASPAQVSLRSSSTNKFICCRPGEGVQFSIFCVPLAAKGTEGRVLAPPLSCDHSGRKGIAADRGEGSTPRA